MTVKITIDTDTILRIIAIIIGFAIALLFLSTVRQALSLIFIAAFLALALHNPVTAISSRITRGRRGAATAIAYFLVVGLIGLFLSTIVPPFVEQTGEFLDNLPEYVDDFASDEGFIADTVRKYELDNEIREFGENLRNQLGDTTGPIFSGITQIGTAIVSLLTVLVLAFFMLVEGPEWLRRFWLLQPEDKREHRIELARRMHHVITSYVNGQMFIALLAASASLVMMLIVGIPFALPLAGLVGLFGLIPLVGATLGSVVVILVAASQSVYAAVAMLIFFLVYQQIENNVIQPYIQSRTLEVSPLLVLIAVIFGISIGGILGGFVAIPAAACIRILLIDYLENRNKIKLEDDKPNTKAGKLKKRLLAKR